MVNIRLPYRYCRRRNRRRRRCQADGGDPRSEDRNGREAAWLGGNIGKAFQLKQILRLWLKISNKYRMNEVTQINSLFVEHKYLANK